MRDLLDDLDRWRSEHVRAALARVVDLDGSARVTDAAMAVNERGEIVGASPGDDLEGAVVAEALRVLQMGRPKLVTFGSGRIHVLLEPLDW
ncbi:MAG TPA: XdhC family protein [Acidimicrobiales bacterium]